MNRLAYFFRLFVPVALLLIAGAWLYANREVDSQIKQLCARDEARVRVGTATLLGKLGSLDSDLVFLASHSTTSLAVNLPSPENIAALADNFMTFSASKAIYDQIRWIDETGMERVRVDVRQGSPVRVVDAQLQDKSKRYYFTETIKLNPGEVFTSPLDLNIEHDQIEVPFKPMLRIATPVANHRGQNRGIVILNYLGSDLFQAFTLATGETDAHAMVVNSAGYWLKSDNPADEWGFMINRPELNLAVRSPAVWQRIRDSDQGQLELDDGLWTWETIYPSNHGRKSDRSVSNASVSDFWKITSQVPTDTLNTLRMAIWVKAAGIVSLLLGLYGLGSWKLANMWRTQAALQLKYKTVADFTYVWETWIDPAGHYLYCSPSCARMTGYSAQAFLADPNLLAEIAHPADLASIEAHLQRSGDVENVCELAFRIVRTDGEIRWVEHACQPVFDDKGAYLGRRASNRDITDRKQAETALRTSHEQMYSLLNSMAEGAYGVDTDGNCRFVNRSFLRILGYENADAIIGKPIHDLIHHSYPDGRPYPAAECRMYAAYRHAEEIHVTDEVFWRKDGTAVPVEYRSHPIVSDGVVTGAIATFVDIADRRRAIEALKESETKFRTLFESAGDAIFLMDQEIFIHCNPKTLAMFGCSREQIIGQPPYRFSPELQPDGRRSVDKAKEKIEAAFSGRPQFFEWTHCRYDGTPFDAEVSLNTFVTGGKPFLQAIVRDISERKLAEHQLRIAATVFEAQEGMMVTDADHVILRVNKAFTNITGYSADEAVGKTPFFLKSDRQNQQFYDAMWENIDRTGAWEGEIWNRRKNGETYAQYLTITAVKDQNGIVTQYVGTFADITLKKKAAEEIEHLAFYDPLTHLPNRRLFQERLRQALTSSLRTGKTGVLFFIDLDNFKEINDTLGHDMGDLLLQQVSDRLNTCVRGDDTVARLGGDEFVVMLEDLSEEQAEAIKQAETIANKILALINQPFNLAHHDYSCTPSIGATLFKGYQRSMEELLKQADIAMYQAKNAGRNAFCFFEP